MCRPWHCEEKVLAPVSLLCRGLGWERDALCVLNASLRVTSLAEDGVMSQ